MMSMSIHDNVEKILQQIGPGIVLVAAVKYASYEQIMEAVDSGIKDVGFNTFQQMEEVAPMLPSGVKIHFIGTLQMNKVKKVIGLDPVLIQSVDSFGLAQKISIASKRTQGILVQVKTDNKKGTGVLPEDLDGLLKKIGSLGNVKVEGLMTIPPYTGNPDDSRQYYRAMRSYFFQAEKALERKLKYLSMGMSGDYMAAIGEGATMVRIGEGIFMEKRS